MKKIIITAFLSLLICQGNVVFAQKSIAKKVATNKPVDFETSFITLIKKGTNRFKDIEFKILNEYPETITYTVTPQEYMNAEEYSGFKALPRGDVYYCCLYNTAKSVAEVQKAIATLDTTNNGKWKIAAVKTEDLNIINDTIYFERNYVAYIIYDKLKNELMVCVGKTPEKN